MHSPAIHDARATITPSQRLAMMAQRVRRAKIASRAQPDTPIILRPPVPVAVIAAPPVVPANPEQDWIERQQVRMIPIRSIDRAYLVDIQRIAAAHFGLPWNVMFSATRKGPVVRARQAAMYLAKTMTPHSLPEIGRRFGGRDHTTVLHAVRKMGALISRDVAFAAEIETIKTAIAARVT
jgi:Bacterial dnaA protein helix-turn-helix